MSSIPIAQYHQFAVAPSQTESVEGVWPDGLDLEQTVVLPIVTGDGFLLVTGIADGPIDIQVAPTDPPVGTWEQHGTTIIEVREPLVLRPVDSEHGTWSEVFAPAKPGRHRIDVFAKGRMAHWDLSIDPKKRRGLEQYMIVISPLDSAS